jgi:hypothetical protein
METSWRADEGAKVAEIQHCVEPGIGLETVAAEELLEVVGQGVFDGGFAFRAENRSGPCEKFQIVEERNIEGSHIVCRGQVAGFSHGGQRWALRKRATRGGVFGYRSG